MPEARNQFTFYRSYYDAIQELGKKDQSAIILAVCAYALYEEEPNGLSPAASTAFKLIRPTLDSGRRKAASGKQGGKSGRQTASKPEANRKQTAREKEEEKELEKEIELESEIEASASGGQAGEKKLSVIQGELGRGVVFLSDAQMDDLLEQMGMELFDHYVGRLADFIIRNDAKVGNHHETILRWWKEDGEVKT